MLIKNTYKVRQMVRTYEKNLKTRMTIRFPEPIADYLGAQAEKMGISASDVVRQIINSHFIAADLLSASAKSERNTIRENKSRNK